MRTRVKKWGNSLALRIPQPFAAELGLSEESAVNITLTEGKLLVAPAKPSKVTLKQLVSRITEKDLHIELKTGPAVGREVW